MASKRTVLITGCSDGGLGAALAHAFHNTGSWRVIATARNEAKLSSVRSAGIETLSLDVVSAPSIAQCVTEVSKMTGGKLDMLLNNAGGGYSMPALDIDLATIRKLYDLNVFSVLAMSRAFFPLLRATPGSKLVNNTSVVSVIGLPFESAYNSSKAAAASLTEGLRIELQPFDIQVIDLKTAQVRTKFFDNDAGDLAADIPADSPYRVPGLDRHVGKDVSRARMQNSGMDADDWARAVVADITKSHGPSHVWRGAGAFIGHLAGFAPVGLLDRTLKKRSGLVGIEAAIRSSSNNNNNNKKTV